MKARAIVPVVLVAACACGTAMAKVTTINVWFWNKDIGTIVDDFEKKYPDIKVKTMIGDWNSFHDKLLTTMVAGSGVPDVTGVEISYMPRFIKEGGLLTALDPYGVQKYKERFVDFRWRLAGNKGKMYALPIDVGPIATWYRPVALAERGLPSDAASVTSALADWDSFLAVSRKLTQDTNGDGRMDTFSLASGARIAALVRQQLGARVMNEDLKVTMDNEDMDKWITAWSMGKSYKDSGYEANLGQRWDTAFQKALKNNKMAFIMEAIWNGTWVKPLGGKWGAAPLPTGVGANDGGSFLAIPSGAKHKAAAWKFLEFVTCNTRSQVELMEKAYWFPAFTPSYSDPYFNEPADWCSGQKYLQVFAKSAIGTKYIPVTRHDTNANTIIEAEIARVMNGKDVRTAIRDAAANIRRSSRGAK